MMNSDINDECVENAVEEFVGAGLSDGSSSKAHPLLLDVVRKIEKGHLGQ